MYSESYWQTILHTFPELMLSNTDIFRELLPKVLTYSELISNRIHNFTELIPSNNKHFFESSNGQVNRQKNFQTENSPVKVRKVNIHA